MPFRGVRRPDSIGVDGSLSMASSPRCEHRWYWSALLRLLCYGPAGCSDVSRLTDAAESDVASFPPSEASAMLQTHNPPCPKRFKRISPLSCQPVVYGY